MIYFVWKDGFNIGVNEMDEQHKLLFNYINELYTAMQSENSEAIIISILNKLADYSQSHFAAEEDLLRSINYPMLETQIKQHAYYVSNLKFLKSSILNKTQTAQNTLLFLKDWIIHHVTTSDLEYAEFSIYMSPS